jgi:pyridoxamine 5'-phosphate oxidase
MATQQQPLRKSFVMASHPVQSIADLREDYRLTFQSWFEQAQTAQIKEPNAMTLATVDAYGRPSARIVLLKGLDQRGFVFFTNYDSRKGQDMHTNPNAALVFFWVELERQVRVEGSIQKISPEDSDTYFHSRPVSSRIGAWASPQSQVISSRAVLEENERRFKETYGEQPNRPPHWGGYRLNAEVVEFWQGRTSRLHDRLRYRRSGSEWSVERLAP